MSLEQGRLSSSSVVLMMAAFLLGASVVLSPGRTHDAWLSVLLGLAGALPTAGIALSLVRRFPGRTMDETAELVYGPFLGKIVAAAFLWYLFHLGSMVLGNFATFFSTAFMPETPRWAFSLLLALVSASAARNGVEVIARCSEIVVSLSVLLILLTNVFLLANFRVENFLPLLETPWKELTNEALALTAFPFGEAAAFLMVLPFLNDPRRLPATVAQGLALGALLLLAETIRAIGVLGPSAQLYSYPAFHATRMVRVGRFLSRMEIIVAVNSLTLGFIKVAVLLYGTSLGAAQLLRLRSHLPLVWPLTLLMVVLSLINFPNNAANFEFARRVYPFYALPFQAGLPLLTLLVAVLRGLPGKQRGQPRGPGA